MGDIPIKLSEMERRVLRVLARHFDDEANCLFFREIAKRLRLTIPQVRRAVRSLARKGLAEHTRGLFSEDGKIAGSGYCCTRGGLQIMASLASTPSRRGKVE